jgi:pantoate--beta-alanine ligase
VKTFTTREALRHALAAPRSADRRIALVPTMGALHAGHLSLLDAAAAHADTVVLSVFVNPLQFGPGEDLARYPRQLGRDAELARGRGADMLFSPPADEMYPEGDPGVSIVAPGLADRLCGRSRPGHFSGVLTVVAKLFNVVAPDVAVFGRKDMQQLVLIRRMVRDLDYAIEIVGAPIVRDDDGLALSSRNAYLTPEQRTDALLLSRALRDAAARFAAGERDPATLVATARAVLEAGRDVRIEYVELADPAQLEPVTQARAGDVLAVAARVGATRLIDNHILGDDAFT